MPLKGLACLIEYPQWDGVRCLSNAVYRSLSNVGCRNGQSPHGQGDSLRRNGGFNPIFPVFLFCVKDVLYSYCFLLYHFKKPIAYFWLTIISCSIPFLIILTFNASLNCAGLNLSQPMITSLFTIILSRI